MGSKLCIAGVIFDFPEPLGRIPINEYFRPFWQDNPAADLSVTVSSINSSDALTGTDSHAAGTFCIWFEDTVLWAVKRNEQGVPLWKLSGSNEMSEYALSYNSAAFDRYYFSVEDLLCKDPGLLMLVLALHARGGLVMHGAAAELEGHGILCVGRSGIGKSTIARILHRRGANILCDERPVVRRVTRPTDKPARPVVYGTPWPNDGGLACNGKVPLNRIYFLEQGPANRIIPLARTAAATRFVQFATILWDHPDLFDPGLETVEALLAEVPAAVLSFKPDEEVGDVIRQDLASDREII